MGALAFSLAGAGCDNGSGEEDIADPDQGAAPDVVDAPDFPDGTGQEAQVKLEYPPGPFGFKPGSIIENFKFMGFSNASVQNDTLEPLELAMFYNPTGDGVYPAGSPFGEGNPKPRVLLIDVASVWCGPCNYEADQVLPGEYAKYKPMGGEFLLQLADGPSVGYPAKPSHLTNWTTKYEVDYPSAVDPSYKLGDLFEAEAFPQNMIIDLRTMEIVEVLAGAPQPGDAFWTKFEAHL
ncbi:MAG: TlpA family protein disulfide reductase [Polyangiaceae bacterium]